MSHRLRWKGSCDGYEIASTIPSETPTNKFKSRPAASKKLMSSVAKSRAISRIRLGTNSTAVVKAGPPAIPEKPGINTTGFRSSEQRSYSDEWSSFSVNFLGGGLGDTQLWTIILREPYGDMPPSQSAHYARPRMWSLKRPH
ncbi:hypothetical protein ACKAV7_012059 [Fusarium commune]